MRERFIVHISREHGSLGGSVAKQLAEELGCPYYGSNILRDIGAEFGLDPEFLERFEEMPKASLFRSFFGGNRARLEKALHERVVEYLNDINDREDRAVILGRNAGNILERQDDVVNIFIVAPMDDRVQNVMELYGLSEEDAERRIHNVDRFREDFHKTHTHTEWRDMDSYDMVINTGKVGIDGAVHLIKEYLETKD